MSLANNKSSKPAAILFVLALLALVFYSTQALADDCGGCRKKHSVACGRNCEKHSNREAHERCLSTCVEQVCAKSCQYDAFTSPNTVSRTPCERCIEKMQSSGCTEDCDPASPRFESCRKQCAKMKCSDQCDLPAADGSEREDKREKYACETCMERAQKRCKNSPDCGTGPGALGCRTACAVRVCEYDCRGD